MTAIRILVLPLLLPLFLLGQTRGMIVTQQDVHRKTKPRIAVLDLDARAGVSADEAAALSDAVQTQFLLGQQFVVVDRMKMKHMMVEQGFQQSAPCSEIACIIELGKILRLDYVIVGSVGKVGKLRTIMLQAVTIRSAIIPGIGAATAESVDELINETIPRTVGKVYNILVKESAPAGQKASIGIVGMATSGSVPVGRARIVLENLDALLTSSQLYDLVGRIDVPAFSFEDSQMDLARIAAKALGFQEIIGGMVSLEKNIATVSITIQGVSAGKTIAKIEEDYSGNLDTIGMSFLPCTVSKLLSKASGKTIELTSVAPSNYIQEPRPMPASGAKNYAIVFAGNNYQQWKHLDNPVPDAEAVAEELTNTYGFQVELLKDPTQSQILTTLRKYSTRSYGDKDNLLIFFASHGQFDEVMGDGYLVANDTQMGDTILTTYISHSNLRTIVNNIRCKHIMLMIDACFGGTFDPTLAAGSRGDDQYPEADKDEFVNRKSKFKTRRFITSGGKEYVPDGNPGQHSPFVRKFLEALRSNGGKDKILTLGELQMFLEKAIPEPRFGEFGKNEPGSDFLMMAK